MSFRYLLINNGSLLLIVTLKLNMGIWLANLIIMQSAIGRDLFPKKGGQNGYQIRGLGDEASASVFLLLSGVNL